MIVAAHRWSTDVALVVRFVLGHGVDLHLQVLAHFKVVCHWYALLLTAKRLERLVLLAKACLVERREVHVGRPRLSHQWPTSHWHIVSMGRHWGSIPSACLSISVDARLHVRLGSGSRAHLLATSTFDGEARSVFVPRYLTRCSHTMLVC